MAQETYIWFHLHIDNQQAPHSQKRVQYFYFQPKGRWNICTRDCTNSQIHTRNSRSFSAVDDIASFLSSHKTLGPLSFMEMSMRTHSVVPGSPEHLKNTLGFSGSLIFDQILLDFPYPPKELSDICHLLKMMWDFSCLPKEIQNCSHWSKGLLKLWNQLKRSDKPFIFPRGYRTFPVCKDASEY